MRTLAFNRSSVPLAAMTLVMLFAAVMHLYLITAYPPGLDPDAAQDGTDALKPARYNVWPFYITINSNPDPLFVYTAAATTQLFGARVLSMRFASALYGLFGLAATYTCLAELGQGSFDRNMRRLIALLAAAALAASQPLALIDRMGLRFVTELPLQMVAIWALARAARTADRRMWTLAGVLAGLTQYTYPSARALPLLVFLALVLKLLQERQNRKSFPGGLARYAGAVVVALLPQLIWYARYPQTFLARATQTSFAQNPVYAEQGLAGVLRLKFLHYWIALGEHWLGQYNQIKEPLLAPLFFVGFILGVAACLVFFRKWFVPLVICGALVMLLPDLISGDREWPHELRLIGAYPFVAAVSGLGLASAWAATRRWRALHWLASGGIVVAIGLTMFVQAREFLALDLNRGKLYWSGNTWLRRIDYGVAHRIDADRGSYLLPLLNYSEPVVKFLTADRVIHLRSAVDTSGSWVPALNQPVTILLPNEDDNALWQGDPAGPWILIEGDTAYVLPPTPNMAGLLPILDDSTLVYDTGDNSIVQIGHVRQVAPEQLPIARASTPEFPAEVCFQPGMCLKGVSYSDWHLRPGGQVRVNLHWQTIHPIKDDYIIFVHLLDRDGNAIAGKSEFPLSHGYRTYEWQLGETVISQTVLDVPADAQPGPYAVEVGFYLPYDVTRANTIDTDGRPNGDRAVLSHLKVTRPAVPFLPDAVPARITFGNELELTGYRIDSLPTESGPLRATLWWRGLKPATQNWTGFFHLTPAADNTSLVGQVDRPLTGGAYPPLIWDRGELVEEQIEVPVGNLAAGRYALWMGIYSPITFERETVANSSGPVQDNRALLLEIELP